MEKEEKKRKKKKSKGKTVSIIILRRFGFDFTRKICFHFQTPLKFQISTSIPRHHYFEPGVKGIWLNNHAITLLLGHQGDLFEWLLLQYHFTISLSLS